MKVQKVKGVETHDRESQRLSVDLLCHVCLATELPVLQGLFSSYLIKPQTPIRFVYSLNSCCNTLKT